jgi:flagellar basal-body rod protein FlgF
MTGAKQSFATQAVVAHNVANANTTGFRADLFVFASQPVPGPGFPTRVNSTVGHGGWGRESGAERSTGRDLDVAIHGQGFIAVQAPDGTEAYTRAGDLQVDAEGRLLTGAGHAVLGQDGPITIPENTSISIAGDGTISVVAQGQGPETLGAIARIKLANPDPAGLAKGPDGLLRLPAGTGADADPSVQLVAGSLEDSNVNVPEAMVDMIVVARRYDAQVRMMRVAGENADVTRRLVSPAG